MNYENECYMCGENWMSAEPNDPCPECNEEDNIGTDTLE